jgi:three-Cys-motif partner protein
MAIVPLNGYMPSYLPVGTREERSSGAYALTKIETFSRYAVSAQRVFKSNKVRIINGEPIAGKLVYLEPFSGPGINLIRETGRRVAGTPLRALAELQSFDIFIFNDLDINCINSLFSELRDLGMEGDESPIIYLRHGDANDLMDELPGILGEHRTRACYPYMGIAAVDPEGLHFRWDSVAKLALCRLDFVNMVATHLDLIRNAQNPAAAAHIERWFGGPLQGRSAPQLLEDYENRLKSVAGYSWQHGVSTSPIPGDEYVWIAGEYHLIFASHCSTKVASEIWKGVCRRARREQGPSLFDALEFSN